VRHREAFFLLRTAARGDFFRRVPCTHRYSTEVIQVVAPGGQQAIRHPDSPKAATLPGPEAQKCNDDKANTRLKAALALVVIDVYTAAFGQMASPHVTNNVATLHYRIPQCESRKPHSL
jgi:hypothetical protein